MRRVSILQNTRTSSDRESVAAEITLPGRVATAQRLYGLVHQNGEDGCKCLGIPKGDATTVSGLAWNDKGQGGQEVSSS